ncbi:serine carboxypeptidase-like 45 isoform X1 [Macadamia integrifolia]|uniref:serine carboxypeptidase-like 45 isoform X1 n=1 Tax=Macadamia integrifolia TaxID=60698 RepID=UPI001C4FA3E4|nr:serine carboxypeptidase-like 45 isoform X1 [Macadamia integrifolia]
MNFLSSVTIAAIVAVFLQLCTSAEILDSKADKINELPGQPKVSFQQFSGYITVDEKQERALFYYFVEAETEPASKPVVLWLNGGPGCSSVGLGAFSEHGPFRPSGERNQYSWNREANMLYLETPAGVGFSYSTNASYYTMVDDKMTAEDNLMFLRRWFVKFPEYKGRDFFITGESYAGHYVPQLALLIVQFNKKEKLFNLKGIALGNPLLEYVTDFNSEDLFSWSHGLISDSTYVALTTVCNSSRLASESFRGIVSLDCEAVASQANRETSRYIDSYDVTLDVCLSSLQSQSKALTRPQYDGKLDVCVQDEAQNYLNRNDVKEALHARLVGVTSWSPCSEVLHYQMLNLEASTIPTLSSLIRSGIRVMVYSGDQDSVIPFIGSRSLVQGLGNELGLNTTVAYRVWISQKQVGGWTEVYGDILSFATIRGASHTAPFSQPERSLVLFNAFLEGKPLPAAF